MEINENIAAQMQMDLVRVCRNDRHAHGGWHRMKMFWPEYSIDQIKEAVKPALRRMMDALEN